MVSQKTRATVRRRCMQWKFVSVYLWKKVRRGRNSLRRALRYALVRLLELSIEADKVEVEYQAIRATDFSNVFHMMSSARCFELFRHEKEYIGRLGSAIGWPEAGKSTSISRRRASRLEVTCVILWRFASPAPWREARTLFGRFEHELSEIFWDGVSTFLDVRGELLSGELGSDFIKSNAFRYAQAIEQKAEHLKNCIGFVDGTVIRIARPSNNAIQRAVYNGHKRSHALKFQPIVLPDGLAIHVDGVHEGRRHDVTLWNRSNLDAQLENIFFIEGTQYKLFGDSAYTSKPWFEVYHSGPGLTIQQQLENADKPKVRVSVEWFFMEVKKYFPRCDYKRSLKLLQAPIGQFLKAAVLLTNFRNCIYPNEISQHFGVQPPTLEEYVSHKLINQ